MNLFVEREFLVNFQIEYDFEYFHKNSQVQNIFLRIISEYPSVRLYTDYADSVEALDESRLINLFTNNNTELNFIEKFDEYFESVLKLPISSIVFTAEPKVLKNRVAKLGGVYFSYEDYESEIGKILEQTEGFVDFSDQNASLDWSLFKRIQILPVSSIIIDDSYVLTDKKTQRIKDNLIPLVKSILQDNPRKVDLLIYTDVVKRADESGMDEVECAEKRRLYIFRALTNYIKRCVLLKNKQQSRLGDSGIEFEQHDRYIYTDFTITALPKGFNLSPFKRGTSKLEIKTIFEKPYYRQLNNHLRELNNYTSKLELESFGLHEFKILPTESNISNTLLNI